MPRGNVAPTNHLDSINMAKIQRISTNQEIRRRCSFIIMNPDVNATTPRESPGAKTWKVLTWT
jgi:hypothetical protein